MDIQKEREAFEKECRLLYYKGNMVMSNLGSFYNNEQTNWMWQMWLSAKAQAVPEGFVLVKADNVNSFYQDDNEPENFCNSSNDWDCLGDGIEKDQIMIVNKHTQAHISTEKFFGVWKLIETSYGTRWKFELFKSEFEAKQAMIKAQEPAND